MPPKKRKADPEELKLQFESWKQSDEYKQMEKIGLEFKKTGVNISSTTEDFAGPWKVHLDLIWELIKMMKTKTGKVKGLEQPYVRSFFFARADKENEKHIIDGIHCGVIKELADTSYTCRHKLSEIIDICKDQLDQVQPDTFQQFKKDLQKKMQEFIKFFTPHIKNGHKVIYEQNMASVFRPLKELIDINYTYRSFQHGFIQTEEAKKAQEKPINCTPDIRKLFYMINLKDWKLNKVEHMYLSKLHESFKTLQKTLWRMWYDGINEWRIPIAENQEMVKNIQALINAEIICERLIGTPLRRDQLNFLYRVILIIDESDELVQKNLKKKDRNILLEAIPRLTVYKCIQYMRTWKDRKATEEKRIQTLNEKMQELTLLRKEEDEKSPLKQANRTFSMTGGATATEDELAQTQKKVKEESVSPQKGSKKKTTIIAQSEDADEEAKRRQAEDEKKYGRYWLLEGLVETKAKDSFEELAERIRHINLAVQQDIDDKIIREGMRPFGKRTDHDVIQAKQYLDKKMGIDNDDKPTIISRPPQLWNYPKILEKHAFRSIAEPKDCYVDNRILEFEEKIDQLAEHLKSHQKYYWDHLVDRVIDVFTGQYNAEPKNLPLTEFHISADKMKWKEV